LVFHHKLCWRTSGGSDSFDGVLQAINGVPRLTEGLNPATWMLQVSTPGMEANIGVNFAEIYKSSGLFQ